LEEIDDNGNSWALAESPAIMSYLCESRGFQDDLYGNPGTIRKATIDSYMHWHHSSTRSLVMLVAPLLRPSKTAFPEVEIQERHKERAAKVLTHLETGWLNSSQDFIAGGNQPSIADLLCYEEIAQLSMTGLVDLMAYPSIQAWVQRMQQVPYHAEVHAALVTLGNLAEPNATSMSDRLRAANKVGLGALAAAQKDFTPSSPTVSRL